MKLYARRKGTDGPWKEVLHMDKDTGIRFVGEEFTFIIRFHDPRNYETTTCPLVIAAAHQEESKGE